MKQATGRPATRTGPARARRERVAAQLLDGRSRLDPANTVRHLVAVQAQDARGARLALRARIPGLRLAEVDACRELVVTWLLRGTLHLVHHDDLPWLHAVSAPLQRRSNAARLRALGVGDSLGERAAGVIAATVAVAPATRERLGEALGAADIPIAGQILPHLLKRAALEGVVVRDLGGAFRAASPVSVDRAAALEELARRYALAHPRATAADLATWAGIPLRDVRGGLERSAPRPPANPPPRLLPPFDPYLLGWKDRSFAIPQRLAARVAPGGGMFRATAVADGFVVGTWRAGGGRVTLEAGADPAMFAAEVEDVERFLIS